MVTQRTSLLQWVAREAGFGAWRSDRLCRWEFYRRAVSGPKHTAVSGRIDSGVFRRATEFLRRMAKRADFARLFCGWPRKRSADGRTAVLHRFSEALLDRCGFRARLAIGGALPLLRCGSAFQLIPFHRMIRDDQFWLSPRGVAGVRREVLFVAGAMVRDAGLTLRLRRRLRPRRPCRRRSRGCKGGPQACCAFCMTSSASKVTRATRRSRGDFSCRRDVRQDKLAAALLAME